LFHEVGNQEELVMNSMANGGDGDGEDDGNEEMMPNPPPSSSMVQKTLADACLVIEALGPKSKERFISDFIADHLQEYEQLYNPFPSAATFNNKARPVKSSNTVTAGKSATTPATASGKSFKKSASDISINSNNNTNNNNNTIQPASLETVEKRFAWYRSKLRSLQHQFAHVFPPQWNVTYRMTFQFLEMTARHLKFVLKKHYNRNVVRIPPFNNGGTAAGGDKVSSGVASKFGSLSVSTHGMSKSTHGTNKSTHGSSSKADDINSVSEGEKAVTALLKALQKTILFEKEMTAWLTRDFGTHFMDPSLQGGEKKEAKSLDVGGGDGDNDLEFDERGRAVAAKSAEGIKIKYERRKKMGGILESTPPNSTNANTTANAGNGGPVPPLTGIASTTFDDHMSPYVALEERSMDEQLHAASSDATVDTRGERPVFVSSTNLFIYMKNSITRCTALTKEKTFFLLQRAFQKKLRSYANVLERKLPPPLSQNAVMAKMALANIQGGGSGGGAMGGHSSSSYSSQATNNTVYRIPTGEEVTICHVIDTCEYCADTVEALEDLIRDKIGDRYKEKIDMGEEQGAFQDVTAKSIRVLVSGLEQRLDAPLKEVSRLTNWSSFDMVGEESSYVRTIHLTVHPFVVQVRELIPSSYFRSFCDKFAMTFALTYYRTLVGLKRISEAGTQQLLLDVYSIKTLLLKLPVLEAEKKTTMSSGSNNTSSSRHHHHAMNNTNLSGVGSTIAPAMYTKMVNKEFRKLEVMLKLVGSPNEMLIDMFRAQWDCSIDTASMAFDFTTIMTLKGIPRTEHASMLETLGVEAGEGGVVIGGADSSTMTANIQALQERGSDVAAKVNADLSQMRQRVDDFRKAFR